MKYNPPFEVNSKINALLDDIIRLAVNVTVEINKNPKLRRENRIKNIHGSLAIEQNTLSIEQVTAVIDGKSVLAPPKDIEEVKNAFEIYEVMDSLNPFSLDDLLKSHAVLMRGLVDGSGAFRTIPAGVVDSSTGNVIHIGTLPDYVPEAVENLLQWLKESDAHPLIKSCVFHYEFELIHPFVDGNGRLGRLWHTLILSKWSSIFAYIPVESMIHKNQQEYYDCINYCNAKANSTAFIEFMLKIIKQTLEEISQTTCSK